MEHDTHDASLTPRASTAAETARVDAGRRLAAALLDDFDVAVHLLGHPNLDRGLDRLLDDVLGN